jgi:hypothetical protein
MATIRLVDATHAELSAFATQDLNLELPDAATRADIIELIKQSGHTAKSFELDDMARRPVGMAARAPSGDLDDYTHVKLTIAMQDIPGGREPVFVSVNGRGMFIPRGEPVEVARRYYESALRDAVEVHYPETQELTRDRSALEAPIETPRFPITVHGFIRKETAKAA